MSTNSLIAVKTKTGKFKAAYCHYDGYPSGVGAILKEFYTTTENANALVDLNSFSSLRYNINDIEVYNDEPDNNRVFNSVVGLLDYAEECFIQYVYLWEDQSGGWIDYDVFE